MRQMNASYLSSQLKRTGEILRNGAGDRILDYDRKFRSFNELYPQLLHKLINSNLDSESAARTAEDFFGSTKVRFAAVDGTEYAQKVFDLIIFFGGAYVATGSLQQLHTYFVGTFPRYYDRTVVTGSFMIDMSILDKTLEFAPGEWLLSSYTATGIENVPIFI